MKREIQTRIKKANAHQFGALENFLPGKTLRLPKYESIRCNHNQHSF